MPVDKARVLVVEDERDLAEVVAYNLRRDGHEVDILPSGHRVLEMSAQKAYGLFLLDVMMPGIKGLELCTLLREQWRTRQSVILVTSAMGPGLARHKVLEAGADDYFPKPFHARELMARVEPLLARAGSPGPFLSYPRFGLDLQNHRLRVADRVLSLDPQESCLLRVISLLPAGSWFSLDRFYSVLWNLGFKLGPTEVEQGLAALNAKLSEGGAGEPFVQVNAEKGLRWSPF